MAKGGNGSSSIETAAPPDIALLLAAAGERRSAPGATRLASSPFRPRAMAFAPRSPDRRWRNRASGLSATCLRSVQQSLDPPLASEQEPISGCHESVRRAPDREFVRTTSTWTTPGRGALREHRWLEGFDAACLGIQNLRR
jgi:hypothetical protein